MEKGILFDLLVAGASGVLVVLFFVLFQKFKTSKLNFVIGKKGTLIMLIILLALLLLIILSSIFNN